MKQHIVLIRFMILSSSSSSDLRPRAHQNHRTLPPPPQPTRSACACPGCETGMQTPDHILKDCPTLVIWPNSWSLQEKKCKFGGASDWDGGGGGVCGRLHRQDQLGDFNVTNTRSAAKEENPRCLLFFSLSRHHRHHRHLPLRPHATNHHYHDHHPYCWVCCAVSQTFTGYLVTVIWTDTEHIYNVWFVLKWTCAVDGTLGTKN